MSTPSSGSRPPTEPYYRALHDPRCQWRQAVGAEKPPCNCDELPAVVPSTGQPEPPLPDLDSLRELILGEDDPDELGAIALDLVGRIERLTAAPSIPLPEDGAAPSPGQEEAKETTDTEFDYVPGVGRCRKVATLIYDDDAKTITERKPAAGASRERESVEPSDELSEGARGILVRWAQKMVDGVADFPTPDKKNHARSILQYEDTVRRLEAKLAQLTDTASLIDADNERAEAELDELRDALTRVGISQGSVNGQVKWWHNRPDLSEVVHDTLADAAEALWHDYRHPAPAALPSPEPTHD